MKYKLLIVGCLVSITFGTGVLLTTAQSPRLSRPTSTTALAGTIITYQGQLKNANTVVNATCDLQFGLWAALTGGSQLGVTETVTNTPVTNGLFTVALNGANEFGYSAFDGDARWLALAVRCPAGSGPYTGLDPRQALTPAPTAFSLPGLHTQQNATSPNIIGGYSGNVISPTLYGATIGGGGQSGNPNRALDIYATVGGGNGNTASGFDSTVAGGAGNMAAGSAASVSGGTLNNANGERAAVLGGFDNAASGDFSAVLGGYYTTASHYGETAHASGLFSAIGDAQTSDYVLRNVTTNTVATELFLDGSSIRLTIPTDRVLTFDILVVGTNSNNGNAAGYRLSGVIKNIGGTTSFVGTPNQIILGEDNAAWDATVVADDTHDALVVQVTGAASTNIRWVASARTVEVSY